MAFFVSSAHADNVGAGSSAGSDLFDADAYLWAYGSVVDSIIIEGNVRTRDFALLREMQTRVGDRLDRDTIERDHRFLSDLGILARVDLDIYRGAEGGVTLRFDVVERPPLLLKLVYPVLEYDLNNDRWRFGMKWNDRNFRRRLESFSLDATRDSNLDDRAAVGWSSRWVGWRQIGTAGRASYFKRGRRALETSVLEQYRVAGGLSLPLTDSRIAVSQVFASLGLERNLVGAKEISSEEEFLIEPGLGYRFDSRDSPLKPRRGQLLRVGVQVNRVVNGEGSTYYRADKNLRTFFGVGERHVLAMQSDLAYQFGRFPEYIRFGVGGAGTLRGYDGGRFRGAHRWIQTVEWRFTPYDRKYFRLPIVGLVDAQVSMVGFVDSGIAWRAEEEFSLDNFHTGFGGGLRLFSPLQDVLRADIGFNRQGDAHFYFSTGTRF